jgi:hypothetical protein
MIKSLLALLTASVFLTMTAMAGDEYFTLLSSVYVTSTEQECEAWLKAFNTNDQAAEQQILLGGRIATLPAGTLVLVKSVGANGIDTIRLKGYPNDLFATSVLGFKVPLAPR